MRCQNKLSCMVVDEPNCHSFFSTRVSSRGWVVNMPTAVEFCSCLNHFIMHLTKSHLLLEITVEAYHTSLEVIWAMLGFLFVNSHIFLAQNHMIIHCLQNWPYSAEDVNKISDWWLATHICVSFQQLTSCSVCSTMLNWLLFLYTSRPFWLLWEEAEPIMGCSTVMGITVIPYFPIGNTVRYSKIWEIPFGKSGFCKAHRKRGKWRHWSEKQSCW